MSNYLPPALALVALVAGLSVRLPADEPARAHGRVVLLENDRALEGEVERQGDRVRIRRAVGELWLPAAQVRSLCADWDDALGVMRGRANLRDPDERSRLAQWCQQHGLYRQAVEEARAALQLRPGHGPTELLLRQAERLASIAARPAVSVKAPPELASLPSLDLNADALGLFTTKVQPILMNTCARCHTGEHGGGFRLMRTYGVGDRTQRTTQHNLAAVMAQVNLERPVVSPLLVKSVSVHGGSAKPPLPSRRSTPYLILREWVETTVAGNPHLREEGLLAAKTTPGPVTPVGFAAETGSPAGAAAPGSEPRPLPATPVTGFGGAAVAPPDAATASTAIPGQGPDAGPPQAPRDEFDPALFNQQSGAGKVQSGP